MIQTWGFRENNNGIDDNDDDDKDVKDYNNDKGISALGLDRDPLTLFLGPSLNSKMITQF